MGPHWSVFLIVGILVLVLFGGRGRISSMMGDFAKGITAFRKGLKDDSKDEDAKDERPAGSLPHETREDERTGS
ncbi:MAG: twin-arginine translocase TatA/TatE family subunit [Caulobacterales bacterium]|uniref:Sec-independent protein translocase TatA n=1 Tax=Glycocaulis sp. TaxID=1969725 RepID=UPI003FA0107E